MSSAVTHLKPSAAPAPGGETAVRIGRIVEILKTGQAVVEFEGSPKGPLPARSILSRPLPDSGQSLVGAACLLAFENNDPGRPIVIGLLHQTLYPADTESGGALPFRSGSDTITVDGDRIRVDGRKEIVLKCGKGSITLRADGKIVLKGTRLISRASGVNKIKGASVSIN